MINIYPLSEGAFTIDGSKQFVPFNLDADALNERNRGSLLVEIQPFALQHEQTLLLFDTGLGYDHPEGGLTIHHNLRKLGYEPEQVTDVILSHLHKDHAGGMGTGASKTFCFPNARYHIHKTEFEYATEKGLPSYDPNDFSFAASDPQTHWLEGEQGTIIAGDLEVEFEIVGGHCPYHLAFWIKKDDQIIFFGGDVSPQKGQMTRRISAKYDYDGKRSMELRQQWWEQGLKEHWTFLFYHDIKTPVKTL